MTEVDSQCLRKGTTRMPQKILKQLLQKERQGNGTGAALCVYPLQGVDTLMPGHLQHTAANIDADLQHTAVKSHVRCDPSLHANKYFLQLLHISTNKYNNKSSRQPNAIM